MAVGSGLLEKEQVQIPVSAFEHFENHQILSFISASIILALLLWRLGYRGKWPQKYHRWYVFLSIMGVGVLMTGASYGGKIVYRHGIGVRQENKSLGMPENQIPPSPLPPSDDMFFPPRDSLP